MQLHFETSMFQASSLFNVASLASKTPYPFRPVSIPRFTLSDVLNRYPSSSGLIHSLTSVINSPATSVLIRSSNTNPRSSPTPREVSYQKSSRLLSVTYKSSKYNISSATKKKALKITYPPQYQKPSKPSHDLIRSDRINLPPISQSYFAEGKLNL